jgi:hypothetical protein
MVALALVAVLLPSMLYSGALEYGFLKETESVTARAMGMGGAYTACGWDYEAVLRNPSALTQIKSKELHLTYSYTSLRDTATHDLYGMSGVDGIAELKLKSIGYVYSFPTIRGSLVAAFGYSRPQDMIDVRSMQGGGRSDKVQSDGHMGQWTAAFGIDAAEKLGLGLSLAYKRGFEDYTKTNLMYKYSQKDYFGGLSLAGGFLYRLPNNLFFAGNIQFLDAVALLSEGTKDSAEYYTYYPDREGAFALPVKAKVGLAYVTVPLTISVDAGYSPWDGIDYLFKGEAAANHNKEFMSIATMNAGLEWLLPFVPVKIRTGVSYLPSHIFAENKTNPWTFAGGFGLILDRSFVIDVGAEISSSDYKYTQIVEIGGVNRQATITESRLARRGLVTLSYRY